MQDNNKNMAVFAAAAAVNVNNALEKKSNSGSLPTSVNNELEISLSISKDNNNLLLNNNNNSKCD